MQVWTHNEDDLANLKYCFENFKCHSLYVRLAGSLGGDTRVDIHLKEDDVAGVRKIEDQTQFTINDSTVWFSREEEMKSNGFRGLSIEYRQKEGFNMSYLVPQDEVDHESIPSDCLTCLRAVWGDYLVEITFFGKIPLVEKGCLNNNPNWKRFDIRKQI